ncbi:hypothetical protein MBLNU459_g3353t1 [Dothideomycetes sp. NU459]
MSLTEWETATAPKVQGTYHLHNETLAAGAQLDFFLLFSSMSGVFGQAGQANYAGANTFLDAFVQYRTSQGLAASSIDIGAVQDVGYVYQDEALLKRMKVAGAHGITEAELLETIGAAISSRSTSDKRTINLNTKDPLSEAFVDTNTVILGLDTSIPLSSPENRAFWRKDRRMAVYHNASKIDALDGAAAAGSDVLKSFLAKASGNSSVLRSEDTAMLLGREIGRKLFSFMLRSDEDLDLLVPLSQLGMDSLVGVEMRGWWRQAFGFDITVLELLSRGNLAALGNHAANGLLKVLGEEI